MFEMLCMTSITHINFTYCELYFWKKVTLPVCTLNEFLFYWIWLFFVVVMSYHSKFSFNCTEQRNSRRSCFWRLKHSNNFINAILFYITAHFSKPKFFMNISIICIKFNLPVVQCENALVTCSQKSLCILTVTSCDESSKFYQELKTSSTFVFVFSSQVLARTYWGDGDYVLFISVLSTVKPLIYGYLWVSDT